MSGNIMSVAAGFKEEHDPLSKCARKITWIFIIYQFFRNVERSGTSEKPVCGCAELTRTIPLGPCAPTHQWNSDRNTLAGGVIVI